MLSVPAQREKKKRIQNKKPKKIYTFLPALFIVGVSFLRISSVPTEQWTKDKVEKK